MMWVSIKQITASFWSNTDLESPATSTNTSPMWNYAQTLLKGVGVLAIGGVAYTFFRSLTTSSATISEENALVTANKKTASHTMTSHSNDQPAVTPASKVNLELRYRSKRDVVPVTSEFLINTYTIDEQTTPTIATLTNGDFVITWRSVNQVNSLSIGDIYAQRFASDGTVLGTEFLVNTYTENDQSYPAIAALNNGGFVIAWWSANQVSSTSNIDIYAQRFANDGTFLGAEFLVSTYTENSQINPAIAALSNGDFVITWSSINQASSISSNDVYAQRFASDGTFLGNEFLVNTYTANDQAGPAIATLSNGNFVITWQSSRQVSSTSGADIYAQRFASDGTFLGTEFLVNTYTASDQASPAIAALSNGDFVITWSSVNQVNSNFSNNIYALRFANNGTALDVLEFLVNTYTINEQTFPAIATLANGDFVITWRSVNQVSNTSGIDIYAQRFASNGTILDKEFLVNTYTVNNQINPAIAALSNDDFVITWSSVNQVSSMSGNDVYADIFTTRYELPLLLQNSLVINQGQSLVFGRDNLLANSGGHTAFANLVFLLSNVQHGQFAKNQTLQPIFNFTQAELQNGLISFRHDESYVAPSYHIAVSNGLNSTTSQAATVDFYQKPQFIRNQFAITNGKTTRLSADELLATTDRNNLEVTFAVQNVSHGVFSLNEATFSSGNAVTNFNQSQINAGQIWFAHDGSNQVPSYAIRAICKDVASSYQVGAIRFTFTATSSNKNTIVGAAVGGTAGALLLAGFGIFGGYRYKKAKAHAEERARYPFANALYTALNIKGVEDFTSTKGITFVNAANTLSDELNQVGIDSNQMIPGELAELAEKLARAIKAYILYKTVWGGIELNALDIQDNAKAIVHTAQTLGSSTSLSNANENEVELETVSKKNDFNLFAKYLQQRGLNMQVMTPAELNRLADAIAEVSNNASEIPTRR